MELNTFLYYHRQALLPEKIFCSPMQAYECAQKKLNKWDIVEHCYLQETCPERCNFWRYDASLSSSAKFRKILEQPQQEYRKTNETSEFAITLAIFYADIQYTVVDEHPSETPESLISGIGGLLGLWLGCSALSLVHTVYFIVQWISRRICNRPLFAKSIQVWTVQKT